MTELRHGVTLIAVTSPEQPFTLDQIATPEPPRRRRTALIVAVAAGVLVLVAGTAAATVALVGDTGPAQPAAPTVPIIANIPRPNIACVPAAEKKITLDSDLTQYQWFGWMDGKQTDMPLGHAFAQRIAGHELIDAWYCPPRSEWKP